MTTKTYELRNATIEVERWVTSFPESKFGARWQATVRVLGSHLVGLGLTKEAAIDNAERRFRDFLVAFGPNAELVEKEQAE